MNNRNVKFQLYQVIILNMSILFFGRNLYSVGIEPIVAIIILIDHNRTY